MVLDKTNDSLKVREQKHLQSWTSKGARLSKNVQAMSERSVSLPMGQNPWAKDYVWTENQSKMWRSKERERKGNIRGRMKAARRQNVNDCGCSEENQPIQTQTFSSFRSDRK